MLNLVKVKGKVSVNMIQQKELEVEYSKPSRVAANLAQPRIPPKASNQPAPQPPPCNLKNNTAPLSAQGCKYGHRAAIDVSVASACSCVADLVKIHINTQLLT